MDETDEWVLVAAVVLIVLQQAGQALNYILLHDLSDSQSFLVVRRRPLALTAVVGSFTGRTHR